MIPVQRNRIASNADDTMAQLLADARAAADALDGVVSHVEDPAGPCRLGVTHEGECRW